MSFAQISARARADARAKYGAAGAPECPPGQDRDPVARLTHAMNDMGDEGTPYWLYDEKKKDPTRSDTSWGPPSPLGSGDAAERSSPFAAGMNIVFGGV